MSEIPLFDPFHIKSKVFRNRVVLSPMCQYKAIHGLISDWHLQHYSRFAFSGLAWLIVCFFCAFRLSLSAFGLAGELFEAKGPSLSLLCPPPSNLGRHLRGK